MSECVAMPALVSVGPIPQFVSLLLSASVSELLYSRDGQSWTVECFLEIPCICVQECLDKDVQQLS